MPIGVAIIGSGAIALANHLPGFALCEDARVIALCDTDPAVLARASRQTGIDAAYSDYRDAIKRDDVSAVVIATPNHLHAQIALDAIASGKHVLCEKPIAMNFDEAMRMYRAAEAAGVRHMTAFTYRFVPAMRYMAHLVRSGAIGQPWHFRASRFQDWGQRAMAWRQIMKLAGSGEMGDMLSHRIDYGYFLVGPIASMAADLARFIDTREQNTSDVDDWVAIIARFASGATGVLESTKLATGRGEGARSYDYCEINGPEGSLIYQLERPNQLLVARRGGSSAELVDVPREFLKAPGSPRDPSDGEPLVVFRYDQDFEFIDAIRNQRQCSPSFRDGAQVQAAMDAAEQAARDRTWVSVPVV